MHKLLPSYDLERRLHAADIIEISGTYLRYSCNRWDQRVPKLHRQGEDFGEEAIERSVRGKASGITMPPGVQLPEHLFLADFYLRYGAFLLGLDIAYGTSMLNAKQDVELGRPPVAVENGVRCPNPRVCFSEGESGYMYDKMRGSALFHILVFASDFSAPIIEGLKHFSAGFSNGLSNRYGGREIFNLVVITKCQPFETEERMADAGVLTLHDAATLVYDDRPPDEDAHNIFGVDHAKGAVVVVRPDLWVGMSAFPAEMQKLDQYFGNFMLPQEEELKADVARHGISVNGTKAYTKVGKFQNRYAEATRENGVHANQPMQYYEPTAASHGKTPNNGASVCNEHLKAGNQDGPSDGVLVDEPNSKVLDDGTPDPKIEEAKAGASTVYPAVSKQNDDGGYFPAESSSVNATH